MMQRYNFPELQKKIDSLSVDLDFTQKIELAEYMLLSSFENEASLLPVMHDINDGIYTRSIFLPKGALLTGKVHNFKHISVIHSGDVTVMTPGGVSRIIGPAIWESEAGTKRLIYVHSDTIWQTYHPTDKTELAEIESYLVHDSDLTWVNKLLSGDKNDIRSNSSGSGGGGSGGLLG